MPEISALPTATLPYDGTEVMPIVQAGETRKATLLPYKVYTALLTQTGTNAPVATVLENTLGGTVVWSYDGVGLYGATLVGAFTVNKTFAFISGLIGSQGGGATHALGKSCGLSRASADLMYLSINDSSDLPADEQLTGYGIEIRVYY